MSIEKIKIPELAIEVTKPVEWTKPYNQIKVPKGWRKITIPHLWFILDGSKYMDEFLGDFKGKWNWFWTEQTDYAKKNEYSSGLGLYRNLFLSSDVEYLADSDDKGRVVFERDLKEKLL